MAPGILSPNSQVLANTAVIIGLFTFGIGLASIINPRFGLLNAFEAKLPSAPQNRNLVEGLVQLFGARNMSLGLSLVVAWHLGHREMMGYLLLGGAGVVAVDGVVQKRLTGGGEWRHWGFVPVMGGLGAGLLGWLDGFA